jgi:hypothetical protein
MSNNPFTGKYRVSVFDLHAPLLEATLELYDNCVGSFTIAEDYNIGFSYSYSILLIIFDIIVPKEWSDQAGGWSGSYHFVGTRQMLGPPGPTEIRGTVINELSRDDGTWTATAEGTPPDPTES